MEKIFGKDRSRLQYAYLFVFFVSIFFHDWIILLGSNAVVIFFIVFCCGSLILLFFYISGIYTTKPGMGACLFLPISFKRSDNNISNCIDSIVVSAYLWAIDLMTWGVCVGLIFPFLTRLNCNSLLSKIITMISAILIYLFLHIFFLFLEAFVEKIVKYINILSFALFWQGLLISFICFYAPGYLILIAAVISVGIYLYITYYILIQVSEKRIVLMQNELRTRGRILLVVIVVIFFISLYSSLAYYLFRDVNNYKISGECAQVMELPFVDRIISIVYYVVCTITTVGYGDIYPCTSISRILAVVMALTGMWLSAVFIGAIIGAKNDTDGNSAQDNDEAKKTSDLESQNTTDETD